MTDSRTILYVAAAETDAHDGAAALEAAAAGTPIQFAVEATTSLETVRQRAPAVDCAVFAETPTTAAGSHLLEVIDACRATPLVLFTDATYGPTAARSTDGIDGYVRCDDGAVDHLVDEIAWLTHGSERARTRAQHARSAGTETGTTDGHDPAVGGTQGGDSSGRRTDRTGRDSAPSPLLESLPDGVCTIDRRGRLTYANEWVGRLFSIDSERVRDLPLEVLATSGAMSAADVDAIEAAVDRVLDGDGDGGASLRVSVATSGERRSLPVDLRIGARDGDAVVTVRPASVPGSRGADARELVASIRESRDESHLYERAVDAAESLLGFDRCGIWLRRDDRLAPVASTEALDPVTLAGDGRSVSASSQVDDTIERGDGVLEELEAFAETFESDGIDRVGSKGGGNEARSNGSDDRANESESTLSIPVGDRGVFVAIAEDRRVIDERVVGAELLASTVATVADRLEVERTLATVRDRCATGVERVLEALPHPGLRYAVVDGEVTVRAVNAAFETRFDVDRETIVGSDAADLVDRQDDPAARRDVSQEAREALAVLTDGDGLDDVDNFDADRSAQTIRSGEDGSQDSSDHPVGERRITTDVGAFVATHARLEATDDTDDRLVIYSDDVEEPAASGDRTDAFERLEEVARIVDVDVRRPLNVARGYLELAIETGDDEHFSEVVAAHDRLVTVVDQVLVLAADDDELVDGVEPVAIYDSARRVWASLETDDANVRLQSDAVITADQLRVDQVLESLIRNAIDHGHERDEQEHDEQERDPITIRIGGTERGFFVEDDGVGIPVGDRERIFEIGYASDGDGAGLGLAIVERIAVAHGWTIHVTESDEGGARFDVVTADAEYPDAESPAVGDESGVENDVAERARTKPGTRDRVRPADRLDDRRSQWPYVDR